MKDLKAVNNKMTWGGERKEREVTVPEPVCVPRATRTRRVMTTNERTSEGAHAFFVCSLLFAEIYGGRGRCDRENSGSGVFRLPPCTLMAARIQGCHKTLSTIFAHGVK